MATSAFKSNTRRTSIGKSSEVDSSVRSSAPRRSRSLSRFSRGWQEPEYSDQTTTPAPPSTRGKFVTKNRGSDFADASLDDLPVQLFDSSVRGCSGFRDVDLGPRNGGAGGGETVSQRRGRSVSRSGLRSSVENSGTVGRVVPARRSSRNRSLSVVRYQISDSEHSDFDSSQTRVHSNMKGGTGPNNQTPLKKKPTVLSQRPVLRRSMSERDLKYQDGYSSHSSALTDDEGRYAHYNRNGQEKTIRAVYSEKKMEHPTGDDMNNGLYEVVRKELRHAVEEIKTEIEHSEKRKKKLVAEMLLEEQRGREFSKIVKDMLPDTRNTVVETPSRTRKRSNDRTRMSRRLTEEAEKYIEDFISNVEDTDISSLDGERSDTSSTFGPIPPKKNSVASSAVTKSTPVEMDGVVLPWLQWETSNDGSPLSCKNNNSAQSASSCGSCTLGSANCTSTNVGRNLSKYFAEVKTSKEHGSERLKLDVECYLNMKSAEDFLVERWNQRKRISTGGEPSTISPVARYDGPICQNTTRCVGRFSITCVSWAIGRYFHFTKVHELMLIIQAVHGMTLWF